MATTGRQYSESTKFCLTRCNISFESGTITWCCPPHGQNIRVPESGAESGGGSFTIISNNPLTEFLFFLETLSSVGLEKLGSKMRMLLSLDTLVPLN